MVSESGPICAPLTIRTLHGVISAECILTRSFMNRQSSII